MVKIGWGAKFALHNGTTLEEFVELTAISVPEDSVDIVETTHFGSAGARREYIAGLIDSGEGEFEINLHAGNATDLLCQSAEAARVPVAYKITIPSDGGTWEITGNLIVMGYSRSIPIDDKMTATLKVKFTGQKVEAAGV